MDWLVTLLGWCVFAVATALAAQARGRSVLGWFLLGLLLAPLALIIVLVIPPNQDALDAERLGSMDWKECRYCAEIVRAKATRCRYCGGELPTREGRAA